MTDYDDGSGTPAETVEYTYDDLGRMSSVVDDRGTTSYTYNNDGLTTRIDSPEGIVRYEYEPLTNRLTRTFTTDAAGEVLNDVSYTYDSLGRLKAVTVVERNDEPLATPEATSYSYDLVGNLVRVDLPNGIVTEYVYDDLNRLDVMTHFAPDATPADLSDNDKIAEFDYDVRADGKRTGVTETYYESGSPETIEIDWTYDNLGRLVDEVFNHYDDLLDQTLHFTHDLVGNRLEQTKDKGNDSSVDEKITYTFDDNDRLLTESKDADNDGTVDQTTTYSYTATEQTGKTVVDESTGKTVSQTSFTYNLEGRLESVTVETYDASETLVRKEVTTYDYDDAGYRVSALNEVDSDGDGTFDTRTLTEYLADPHNHTGYTQTLEETVTDADTGAEIKKIVYTFGHDAIAQTTFTPSGPEEGESIVLLYDGHGSTRLIADLAAEVLEEYAYDAYGNAIGFDPAAALTTLLYSGESFDPRINQQYLRARWYDAQTGRFNRLDPFAGNLRDPQSLHKYLYTHADPVNGIDPTGMFTVGGLISGMGIGATVGGTVNATIVAIGQKASLKTIAGAFLHGMALGAFFGGGAYVLTSFGVGFVSSGGILGSLEGFFASLLNNDPWRIIIAKTAFGGLLGALFAFAGGQALKRIGKALEPLAQRIASSAAPPNPSALASASMENVTHWTIQRGGFRLAKVGEYWIKEVDPSQVGGAWYGEHALQAQLRGLERLGNLAPEYAYINGRLIIRDVGAYTGSLAELAQIRLLGSLRLGTIFNDITRRNVGSNGQIFDPSLTPVHELLGGILVLLGETVGAMYAWNLGDEDFN